MNPVSSRRRAPRSSPAAWRRRDAALLLPALRHWQPINARRGGPRRSRSRREHDVTAGWTVPLIVLVVLTAPFLYCGWIACADRTVENA
jgi:hypothetical protein